MESKLRLLCIDGKKRYILTIAYSGLETGMEGKEAVTAKY